jgi:hypothetical protein
MDFVEIEDRFGNLNDLWNSQTFEVQIFEDDARALAFTNLTKLQRLLRFETDLYEPILEFLSFIHWDLRGFVGMPEVARKHWESKLGEFDSRVGPISNSFDEQKKIAFTALRTSLLELAANDENYGETLLKLVTGENSVVVTERKWQKPYLEAFLDGHQETQGVSVLHLNSLFVGDNRYFENFYILAAPGRISDNFMRALVLGGAIPSSTFISANWLVGSEPQKVRQNLAPGLNSVRKPVFTVRGAKYAGSPLEISDEDFNNFAYSPVHGEFEKFSATGSIPCRLVEIANNYVMPVELGASKVSILSSNADGVLEVQSRDPNSTLEAGDILFELRDGADEDFLMDLAQIRMGKSFLEFARGRIEWKRRAEQLISENGYQHTVDRLRKSGVSTADNLRHWLENVDFTTPRASKDWHNLLKALEFNSAEIAKMESLGSDLRSKLIAIGQDARRQMADAVSPQDLEIINGHEVVTKQLDEFGDAVFVLGMVTSLGTDQKSCEPTEIRRVLRK